MLISEEEFYAIYGEVKVTFSSYYKFAFLYTATLEHGERIVVRVGGNGESIYNMTVEAGVPISINSLQPSSGWVTANGAEIAEFKTESW
jgi:hypothetical protein